MIGIIGIGKWGKNLLRVCNEISTVSAVTNKSDEAAREFVKANYPDIKIYSDYKELLKDLSIKAVVIATPIATHFKIAKEALEAGKHVFVEKPIAQTVGEAETLVRTAKDQQLFVGHIFLYHPIYTKVKELCAKDHAVSMNAVWNKTGTFDEDIIKGLVSHDIALAIGLFDAMPVKADLIMKKGIVTEADIVKINVSFSGKKCTIETNRMFPKKSKIITIETQSGAVYYWIDDELYKLNGDKFDLIFESKEEPLKIELQTFLNAIKNNTSPVTNGEFGVKVMKALELIG